MFEPSSAGFTATSLDKIQNFTGFALSTTSGTIKNNTGGGNINATVYVYDVLANSTETISANGLYAADSLIEGKQYVITPEAANFRFEPVSSSFTATNLDLIQNFIGFAQSKTTGTVMDAVSSETINAVMSIYDVAALSTTTVQALSGFYSSGNMDEGKQYVITPILANYMFVPPSVDVTATNSDIYRNFAGYALTKTGGTVLNNIGGGNIDATVYVWDSVANTTATISANAGSYVTDQNLVEGRNYVVTPSADRFVFVPAVDTFTASTADRVMNFTGYALSYATVTLTNQAGGSNVNANITIFDATENASTSVAVNGSYVVQMVEGRSYVITPDPSLYEWTPSSWSFTATNSDTAQSFIGARRTQAMGTILNNIGGGAVSAYIYVNDGISVTTETVSGSYDVGLVAGRNYVITPSADRFKFVPSSFTFTAGSEDQTNNFVGYALSLASGTIINNINGSAVNADVAVYDVLANSTATIPASGFYASDYLVEGQNYVISIDTEPNFIFTPLSYSLTASSSDVARDFTAFAISHTTGTILNNAGGSAVNALLYVYDAANNSVSTITADGFYTTNYLVEGSTYTLTPSADRFLFVPSSVTFTATATGGIENFTGYATSILSGTVKDAVTGTNVAGAGMSVYDGFRQSTSAYDVSDGNYSLQTVEGYYYELTSFGNGVVFTTAPYDFTTSTFTLTATNQDMRQDFLAYALTQATGAVINNIGGAGVNADIYVYDVMANSTITIPSSGFYATDNLIEGKNYVITPEADNFIFKPSSYSFMASTSDIVGNFTAYKFAYVSATVTNDQYTSSIMSGTMTISDGFLGQDISIPFASTFSVSYRVIEGMNYNITPSANRILFVPSNSTFTATASGGVETFTGYATSILSGTVKTVTGANVANGSMSVYDDFRKSTTSYNISQGSYSVQTVEGYDYELTPFGNRVLFATAPYDFDTATFTWTATNQDKRQDFTAYALTNASGTVLNNKDGSNVTADVYIYDVMAGSTLTIPASGFYADEDLIEGKNYEITPQADNFIFKPAVSTFTAGTADRVDNFKAYKFAYVSATVTNIQYTTAPVSGTTTITDGFLNKEISMPFVSTFSYMVVEGMSYNMTPAVANAVVKLEATNAVAAPYSFTVDLSSALPALIFDAYPSYKIGGEIAFGNAQPAPGIDVDIYDIISNSTHTVTTGDDGRYSYDGVYNSNYTVTPHSEVYKFNKTDYNTGAVTMPQVNLDFTVFDSNTKIIVYPNPYKPSNGSKDITFANVKAGSRIRIFDIVGEKVFDCVTGSDGQYLWDVSNNSGSKIASGVYIYYIEFGGNVTKGKLAVER